MDREGGQQFGADSGYPWQPMGVAHVRRHLRHRAGYACQPAGQSHLIQNSIRFQVGFILKTFKCVFFYKNVVVWLLGKPGMVT